jgi:hypothetical protein
MQELSQIGFTNVIDAVQLGLDADSITISILEA